MDKCVLVTGGEPIADVIASYLNGQMHCPKRFGQAQGLYHLVAGVETETS